MFHEFKFDPSRFENGNQKKMLKLVFMGVSGSGKTTIINQFINNHFIKDHVQTTDGVIYKKKFNLYNKGEADESYYVEILDTMDLLKNIEDEFREFFQDLSKAREVSITTEKFKQKNGQILKYEYFNEKTPKKKDGEEEKKKADENDDEFKTRRINIDTSKFGLFSIVPVMAYIYVLDCLLDIDEPQNLKIVETVKSEALKIYNAYKGDNDEVKKGKPLQFFVANKFPYYLKPDKNSLKINYDDRNSFKACDNIIKIKEKLNESGQLVNEENSNFFVINAENTRIVHLLFENIISQINSSHELLELKRLQDDPEEETDNDEQTKEKKSFFKMLCCSDRDKKKNEEERRKEEKHDDQEKNDTQEKIDDIDINYMDEKVNVKSKIQNGVLVRANEGKDKQSGEDNTEIQLTDDTKKGCVIY